MKTRTLLYAGASVFVSGVLFYFVFPAFVGTYSESGGTLPAITQFAIDVRDGDLRYAWAMLFAAAAIAVTAVGFMRRKENVPATRDARVLIASAVTGVMLIVAAVFLAAVITPMFPVNA